MRITKSRRAVGVALAIGFSTASGAQADESPVTRQVIATDMRAYYQSEKNASYLMLAVGVFSMGASGVSFERSTDFSRGLGGSLLTLGALEAIGAVTYLFTVNGEIADWSAALASDPGDFKARESVHIQGTTDRFFYYRIGEAAVLAAGVGAAVYGFAANRDLWKGIGLGAAFEAAVLFTVDSFGQRRALDYKDELGRFQPTLAFQLTGNRQLVVGLSRSF